MDILNNAAGVFFGWFMLSFILLPLLVGVESLLNKYVKYSTKDEVSFTSPLTKFWRKWLSTSYHYPEPHSWVYKKDLEVPLILLYIGIHLSLLVLTPVLMDKKGMLFYEAVSYSLYGMWVEIGATIAPVLLVVIVMFLGSSLSRKIFGLKQKLKEHIEDKKAHS